MCDLLEGRDTDLLEGEFTPIASTGLGAVVVFGHRSSREYGGTQDKVVNCPGSQVPSPIMLGFRHWTRGWAKGLISGRSPRLKVGLPGRTQHRHVV